MTALMLAASKGDAATVKALLAAGANPNATARDGRTALMEAASQGSLEAVQALLAAGANVNARTAAGATALQQAVRRKDEPGIVEALKQAGAK
jgi:ankyrin repeat protein